MRNFRKIIKKKSKNFKRIILLKFWEEIGKMYKNFEVIPEESLNELFEKYDGNFGENFKNIEEIVLVVPPLPSRFFYFVAEAVP